MGFNTSVLILNDNLHEITKDQEFGLKISRAVQRLRHGQVEIIYPKTTVVETHHADGYSVVAFGENRAIHFNTVYPWNGDEEFNIRLLRTLADSLGFQLRKKPLHGPYSDASKRKE